MKRLACLVALLLIAATSTTQTSRNYYFLRDGEHRPIYGSGIRPTVTAEMGIPVGTPFYDTSTYSLYYWSGTAWTATSAAGGTISGTLYFEGATDDDFETAIAVLDPTADNVVGIPNATGTFALYGSSSTEIPNNTIGATPAAYTKDVTPRNRLFLVTFTCNDPDGCDITMGETSIENGQEVTLTNVSAVACNFADTPGVTELAGPLAMGQYDTLHLIYATDRWVEVNRSDN